MIMLSSTEKFYYRDFFQHIATKIDEHMQKFDYSKFPEGVLHHVHRCIEWFVNIYVDACHSGSALSEGKIWAEHYNVDRRREYLDCSEYYLEFFKSKTFLKIMLFSSTSPE